jgi:hypothetical protein
VKIYKEKELNLLTTDLYSKVGEVIDLVHEFIIRNDFPGNTIAPILSGACAYITTELANMSTIFYSHPELSDDVNKMFCDKTHDIINQLLELRSNKCHSGNQNLVN